MGRKKMYHTEEEKAEAKRRNRMQWYDRNRSKILKAYKLNKGKGGPSTTSPKGSKPVGAAPPKTGSAASSSKAEIVPLSKDECLTNKSGNSESAPQMLLGRVHKQSRLLHDFMLLDIDDFCARVAEEVIVTAEEDQLRVVQSYMDSVAAFIDAARPHTVALFNTHGAISEWKEAKQIQNSMGLVMQYLDEIYHHVGLGDLAAAAGLNLLSFL